MAIIGLSQSCDQTLVPSSLVLIHRRIMPRGVKCGAALSQVSVPPNANLSLKCLRVDDDRVEVIDDESSSMRTVFVAASKSPKPQPAPPVQVGVSIAPHSHSDPKDAAQDIPAEWKSSKQPHKPPSQDFLDCASLLIMLSIAHDYDADIETPCLCGKGVRTVQCQDCQELQGLLDRQSSQ